MYRTLSTAAYPDKDGRMLGANGGLSREQWGEEEPSAEWLMQVTAGWRRVFMLAVAVDLVGIGLYGALVSGERLPWAPRSQGGGSVDE